MRYTEVNLFGVYVAPMAPMIVVAWVVLIPLRHVIDRFGLLRYVWHPALVLLAIYIILLSGVVLLTGWVAG
jgi:hypothetical protein